MLARQLPPKVRVALLDPGLREPVRYAVVTLELELALVLEPEPSDSDAAPSVHRFVMRPGALSTDHVGYASFSLRTLHAALARIDRLPNEVGGAAADALARLRMEVERVMLRSPLDPDFELDLHDELSPPHLEGPLVETLQNALRPGDKVIAVPATSSLLERLATRPAMPSIQEPDVDDWRLSPYSFGMSSVPAIGEAGCETLLPSHEPDRLHRMFQIQRTPSLDEEVVASESSAEDPGPSLLRFKRGKLVEYQMEWRPLNHGLGRVLYSLTLAPCEAANIATIDWLRNDEVSREEATRLDDDLQHQQRRERVVDETVEATVREFQAGSSFQGGTAGVGGYGQGMWGVTGSHAIGYAEASTEGRRDVEASTVQRLADSVAQSSRMVRDLRSTVVVQATQEEAERILTRTVRNHNHSHALTVLYFEVVRHYLVTTRAVRERDVVFLRRNQLPFDAHVARSWRFLLRPALLEPRYADDFDHLGAAPPATWQFKSFIVEITSPTEGDVDVENDRVIFRALTQSGIEQWPLRDHYLAPPGADEVSLYRRNTNTFVIDVVDTLGSGIPIDRVRRVGINMIARGDSRWTLRGLRVGALVGVPGSDEQDRLLDIVSQPAVDYHFHDDGDLWFDISNSELDRHLSARRSAEHRMEEAQGLIRHLNDFALHYNRHIWANEDPDLRLSWLGRFPWPPDEAEGRLSDFVDPRPLGFHGPYQAFAWGPEREVPADEVAASERIVALPTRGAFAETQLSHCNASEIIDDTRFWDWSVSPCPGEAPQITGISPGSRYHADLLSGPTAFGPSAIGIEDPEAAPAPSGLSELLDKVMRGDVFRDMSAREQLAAVLQELTKAAAAVESKRLEGLAKLAEAEEETKQARHNAEAERLRTERSRREASGGDSPAPGGAGEGASAPASDAGSSRSAPAVTSEGGEDAGPASTETPSEPDSETPRPSPSSGRRRRGPEHFRLTAAFFDQDGAPLRGQHLVKVWGTREGESGRSLVGRGTTNSLDTVGVDVPTDVRSDLRVEVFTSRARLPNWMSTETLRRFVTGSTPILERTMVRLASSLSQTSLLIVDPEDPATYLLSYHLRTSDQDVTVRGHLELRATIERSLRVSATLGLADLLRLPLDVGAEGGSGSSIEGGGSGEVETTFRLRMILDSYQQPVTGSSGRPRET